MRCDQSCKMRCGKQGERETGAMRELQCAARSEHTQRGTASTPLPPLPDDGTQAACSAARRPHSASRQGRHKPTQQAWECRRRGSLNRHRHAMHIMHSQGIVRQIQGATRGATRGAAPNVTRARRRQCEATRQMRACSSARARSRNQAAVARGFCGVAVPSVLTAPAAGSGGAASARTSIRR